MHIYYALVDLAGLGESEETFNIVSTIALFVFTAALPLMTDSLQIGSCIFSFTRFIG